MVEVTTQPCTLCKKSSKVLMSESEFARLKQGEHIQKIFPQRSNDERELLITGTHPECWDKMFPNEDNEEWPEDDNEAVF